MDSNAQSDLKQEEIILSLHRQIVTLRETVAILEERLCDTESLISEIVLTRKPNAAEIYTSPREIVNLIKKHSISGPPPDYSGIPSKG